MSPYSGILMAQNYPPSSVQQFPPILWGDIELGVSCDEALPNTHLDEVCNEVLLSHARLYRLALKSGWESLCAAALQRLTIALSCSTRSEEHTKTSSADGHANVIKVITGLDDWEIAEFKAKEEGELEDEA
ncbi:hypothetical protein V6Z93_002756 [Aspergillus fumigatus]